MKMLVDIINTSGLWRQSITIILPSGQTIVIDESLYWTMRTLLEELKERTEGDNAQADEDPYHQHPLRADGERPDQTTLAK